ncbi:MAG: PHP domain-containing protein [Nitrososphaerales archaeon]
MGSVPDSLSDNHSHILYENLQSMILAAKLKKLKSISVTEHISQFKKVRASVRFGSTHNNGRIFSDFEEYLIEFENVADHAFPIKRGLEVDYIESQKEVVAKFVRETKWDILLASVHELSDGTDIETQGLDETLSEERWQDYIELEKSALKSDFIDFDVLTHPVRLARSSRSPPSDLNQQLVALAELAKKQGKALELNGKDLVRDYLFVERLASACAKARCKVSFGSDAHHPIEVARGYEKAQSLANHFGLEFYH